MTTPLSDERLREIRDRVKYTGAIASVAASDLLAEIDRLKAVIASLRAEPASGPVCSEVKQEVAKSLVEQFRRDHPREFADACMEEAADTVADLHEAVALLRGMPTSVGSES
jgi:hypothetical protein